MTDLVQVAVFLFITVLIGWLTYRKCRDAGSRSGDSNKEYFLASGGLSWFFVAGSITLTNLSTDQLVGMNGNQMLLLAWWELSAVAGLVILATVFLPIYYRYNCTTTTELLELRYNSKHIRVTIAGLFLLGNVFIYLPIMLYTGSLFMQSMFDIDIPIIVISFAFAIVGAAYAIFGGLRAVAVSDTYSGIGLLSMAILVVVLALVAIDFDFSGIPAERLTLIGSADSPIPWQTLFTGMLFIQIFYWSTNQTITQRAMAAPNVAEAKKGVFAAAIIRLMVVPAVIVIPGICAYKLYGDVGDAAYGMLVADLLPNWLSGAFAAMMAAAVLTSFNSVLNSSATLYVCDFHEKFVNQKPNVHRLNTIITLVFAGTALLLVPVYNGADSIINLVQELNGLLSMPILSAFITGLLFTNVDARAVIISVIFGTGLYAMFTFITSFWSPIHYIHLMLVTLIFCVCSALIMSQFLFGKKPLFGPKLLPLTVAES
ncbi:MAG: SSS family solute:Na+ symporter [Flavobacterium sp.]|jgi:SSS family solute:Na+ symporter